MNYTSVHDIDSVSEWVDEALALKKNPWKYVELGKQKTLVLLFFNPSLRTRLSTQKAALYLGMNVMVMNFGSEGWTLEYKDGTIMDQGTSEHIKEAAQVVSQYADIIAIRSFAKLEDRIEDYREKVLNGFVRYASAPIINMESCIGHPLQALTDAITIREFVPIEKPKIVLSWAPHPKALPQAVANSFVEIMVKGGYDLTIACPEAYKLSPEVTGSVSYNHDPEEAYKDADVVYAKNWSSYEQYGQVLSQNQKWQISHAKMKLTNNAKFMHCLPVRRNVVVEDAVLDSKASLVIEQANNRTFAAQLVLKKILEHDSKKIDVL